jgi:hypothetical protein
MSDWCIRNVPVPATAGEEVFTITAVEAPPVPLAPTGGFTPAGTL